MILNSRIKKFLFQIEGAFVQGIGFFMLEEYLTNSKGLVVAEGTWTYKIPTVDTIPKKFNVEILNSGHHKERILSSKGKFRFLSNLVCFLCALVNLNIHLLSKWLLWMETHVRCSCWLMFSGMSMSSVFLLDQSIFIWVDHLVSGILLLMYALNFCISLHEC